MHPVSLRLRAGGGGTALHRRTLCHALGRLVLLRLHLDCPEEARADLVELEAVRIDEQDPNRLARD